MYLHASRDREFVCLRLKRSLVIIKQDVLPHARCVCNHSREFSRRRKGTSGSVLRKKGSSNLTEDGSKKGRYLSLHLQVNRRIIRDVASLKADILSC